MKTSLFFSGESAPAGPLAVFCREHNCQLTAQSLLSFQALPFTITQPYDVVFFASPRAVNYFFSRVSVSEKIAYACVGKGTAAVLNDFSSSIAFIGEKSGDPEKVAQEFNTWLGNRRVLFPLALHSNETIAKAIPAAQQEIVRCYETHLLELPVAAHDYYVFTSPSNVHAFLKTNVLPAAARVIAWGKTTEKALLEQGIAPVAVLSESSETALVAALQQLA